MSNQGRSPTRPFPWRCVECGARAVEPSVFDHTATLKHDGKAHEFKVEGLEAPRCKECGEFILTDAAAEQITDAFRGHLSLLTPNQIRSRLKELGLRQTDLARATGIAAETVSRWLSGVQLQSRALDRFIRVYFEFDAVRDFLENPASSMDAPGRQNPLDEGNRPPASTSADARNVADRGSTWAFPRLAA